MVKGVLSLVVVLCLQITAFAVQPWKWTPKGKHHEAVVYVHNAEGYAGTGCLVQSNDKYGVILTAAHVIGNSRQVSAKWQDGKRANGRVLYCNESDDVALFAVDPPDGSYYIPMTSETPPIGAVVECVGLGSPLAALRHYEGTVRETSGYSMTVQTPVTHGDSGGPIIYNGKVIGAITGGINTIYTSRENWKVYSPMVASNVSALKKAAHQCQMTFDCPGGCYEGPVQKPLPPLEPWVPPKDPVTIPEQPIDQETLLAILKYLQSQQPSIQPVPGVPSVQPVPGVPSVQPVPSQEEYLKMILQNLNGRLTVVEGKVSEIERKQLVLTPEQKQAVTYEIYRRFTQLHASQHGCLYGMLRRRGIYPQ